LNANGAFRFRLEACLFEWTVWKEHINKKTAKVGFTNRSDSKYLSTKDGVIAHKIGGIMSNIELFPPNQGRTPTVIGGKWKEGSVGTGTGAKKMFFMDLAVNAEGGDTTMTQFRSTGIVLCGMTREQRVRAKNAAGGKRYMGSHFCRIGLPLAHFHPIMEIGKNFVTDLDSISFGEEYVYLQASWGVKDSPCNFQYNTASGIQSINSLEQVHNLLGDKSCVGLGSIGISLGGSGKVQNGRTCVDTQEVKFSVKLYELVMNKTGGWSSGMKTSTASLDATSEQLESLGLGDMEVLSQPGVQANANLFEDAGDGADDDDVFGGGGDGEAEEGL
jgi:hypothetical protein